MSATAIKHKKLILFIVVTCLLLMGPVAVAAWTVGGKGPWYPYIEGWGRYGDYREGGHCTIFAPIFQEKNRLVFGEGRVIRLRRQTSGEAGLGYRQLLRPGLAWGVNGFFDYTRSDAGFNYYQGSFGGELFWNCWEVRANGYFSGPQSYRMHEEHIDAVVLRGTKVIDYKGDWCEHERAYSGFNADIGYNLEFCRSRVRGWAGYYYYRHKKTPQIQGPRLRLHYEYDDLFRWCGSRLVIGVEWQYDQVRKSESAILAGLRVPFGTGCKRCCPRYSSVCRRMGDPVQRELGPVIIRQKREGVEKELLLGHLYFVENGGKGTGSRKDPTNLFKVGKDSQPDDVIVVLNDKGPITDASIQLQTGQRLLGFGDELDLTIPFGLGNELTITDEKRSGRASLTGRPGAAIVTLAKDNTVSGLTFESGQDAIFGRGVTGCQITDCWIQHPTGDGIRIERGCQLHVDGCHIGQAGQRAVHIQESTITLTDCHIDRSGGVGIALIGGALTCERSAVRGSGDSGVEVLEATGCSLSDCLIAGNHDYGLVVKEAAGPVCVSYTTIEGNGNGVSLNGGTASCLFDHGVIRQEGGTLLQIERCGGEITFDNTPLHQQGGRGICVANTSGGTVTIDQAQLHTIDGPSIVIDQSNSSFALHRAHLAPASGADGIVISGSTAPVTICGKLEQCQGKALQLAGVHASVDLTGLEICNHDTRADGVITIDRAGPVSISLGAVTISDYFGSGLVVRQNDAQISVQQLAISGSNGPAILAVEQNGTLSVQGSISVEGGAAIDLRQATVDLHLSSLRAQGAEHGIALFDTQGSVTVAEAVIAKTKQSAIAIEGGSAQVVVRGFIDNRSGHLLSVDHMQAGRVDVGGSLTDVGGRGILMQRSGAHVVVRNARIQDSRGSAVTLFENTGSFTLDVGHLIEPDGDAITIVDNPGAFYAINGGAIDFFDPNLYNGLTVRNGGEIVLRGGGASQPIVLQGAGGQAIDIDHADRVELDHLVLEGTTLRSSTGAQLFDVRTAVKVTNCAFRNLENDGLVIDNLNHEGTLALCLVGNDITGMALSSTAIAVNYEGMVDSEVHVIIADNVINGFDFNGISLRAARAGQMHALMEGNHISDVGFGHGLVVLEADGPTLNATLRKNHLTASGEEIVVAKAAPATGNPLRLNLFENKAPGYQLHSKASSRSTTAFHLGGTLHKPGTIIDNSRGHIANELISNGNRNEEGDFPVRVECSGYHKIIDPTTIPLPVIK